MTTGLKWMVLAAAVMVAQAQVSEQIRRAAISGSGGTSGKCTIEVRVDMIAEVDIYGDSGRLRTLAGQPATWARMDCSSPLPYNLSDFRFAGIDGRGNVKLVQDPRNNNSMAVIHIEDPRPGSEGYTFDIEWSGASGGYPTNGFTTSGYTSSTTATSTSTTTSTVVGPRGAYFPRRGVGRGMTAEQAIDLCRTELRTRSERDYGMRNIDITAAAVDTNQGRSDWVTGTFSDRSGAYRRRGTTSGYRFNCAVDYSSRQVRTLEILRADGGAVQPLSTSGTTTTAATGTYDQNQVYRACQDAVVARTNRDGYQNVNFTSTAIDTSRSGRVAGTITATRGPVTDTFDFACSMDFSAARVNNVELNRR
ncbi:MAG: hypothetical protein LLG20_21885 [Acidobacteriales bacterium]|nr:hypothetical protein [Terriglobales bacterium]